jgi:ribonuclease HI
MELKAFLKAFELLNTKYKNYKSTIYSDSAYCLGALTSWIYTWSKNGWINSKKETVKNLDIIKSIYKYYTIDFFISQINFVKVSGHNGIIGNELADALATSNKAKFSKIILSNHINIDMK